ncbi:hypothetical protein [Virgibacillus sp. SK37]|uniref:hypothetical protein n=1 Tax=Virgibacillus sp. SK37 TaxID=403957 RepID=UPI0004D0D1EB|nr:hypothetical protein [Virgibacillus sp. SK37]AIF45728.1 hypothetical protein X953_19830 [Virgibacillus sp. SK37]
MSAEILQAVVDIVFSGYMLYLAPFLFLLMVVLFADRLIDLVTISLEKSTGRRSRY